MQLAPTNAAEVLLSGQLAAHQIVVSMQLPFLIAIVGAALTLRRRSMRGYALVYALLTLAGLLNGFAVRTVFDTSPKYLLTVTLLASICTLVAMCFANRAAGAALAGGRRIAEGHLTSYLLLAVCLAVAGTALVVFAPQIRLPGVIRARLGPHAPGPVILILVFLLLFSWCAVDAWRQSTVASRNRDALRLVAVSFCAPALRQLCSVAAIASAHAGHPADLSLVTFVQTSTTVLGGVALFAAFMLVERTEMAVQAEQVRTTSLHLAQAKQLESLGRMAGGIAHDFANVLMVIQCEVAGARDSRDVDAISAHLAGANAAVDRATGLTRQLALFAAQRPPAVTTFIVAERLATIAPVLRRLAGPLVSVDLDHSQVTEATIAMDASQFDQIFLNLIANARDAMPEGGVLQLRAQVLPVDRANRDVLWDRFETAPTDRVVSITVRDTGSGMPDDVVDRIFEPFFSTKGDRGTGLGLATVLSVVRTANGAISVISAIGAGSTFIVQLPLATSDGKLTVTRRVPSAAYV